MIFTIGHSTRTVDELVLLLLQHGVSTLVDIRSIRRSRANPQFNADTLGPALVAYGLDYRVIEALGGRRSKPKVPPALSNAGWRVAAFRNYADYALGAEFRAGLADLMALGDHVAIMCAEAVWWRCHRRIVTDHLLARGVPVIHILSETSAEVAATTPFAVVEGSRVHYPALRTSPDRTARSRRTRSRDTPPPHRRAP